MQQTARTIATAFTEEAVQLAPLGNGNINDTFLVTPADSAPFVLQRINSTVFPDPKAVVRNSFRLAACFPADCGLQNAAPMTTFSGDRWMEDDTGELWRALHYLPHRSFTAVQSRAQAYSLGAVLGRFHTLLASLQAGELEVPLPGFHDLEAYLQAFDCSCFAHSHRLHAEDAETVARLRPHTEGLAAARAAGEMALCGVHGDPKCDNFIFDAAGEACGLLDLDTVAPGLRLVDLGDCLRSCCNPAGEEGTATPRVDEALFSSLITGYCSSTEMTEGETELVWDALLTLSFELGVRFLTDHLQGNRHFRVLRDGHNLWRARRQFELAGDILRRESTLRPLVEQAYHSTGKRAGCWRATPPDGSPVCRGSG